jgi:hypothetical protein
VVLVERIDPQAPEPPLVAARRLVGAAADVEAVAAVVGEVEALVRA